MARHRKFKDVYKKCEALFENWVVVVMVITCGNSNDEFLLQCWTTDGDYKSRLQCRTAQGDDENDYDDPIVMMAAMGMNSRKRCVTAGIVHAT